MTTTPIKLVDFDREPLQPVEFPNGHVYEVKPLGVEEYGLLEGLVAAQDAARALELLRRILQGVTDADLSLLTPRMVIGIVMHARHQLELVKETISGGGSLADLATAATHNGKKARPKPMAPGSKVIQ